MRKPQCPARRSARRTTARVPGRKFLRREVEAALAPPARLWGNCHASHFSVSFGPKFVDHEFVLQSDGTDDYASGVNGRRRFVQSRIESPATFLV
jgi:hypothetical protein